MIEEDTQRLVNAAITLAEAEDAIARAEKALNDAKHKRDCALLELRDLVSGES